MLWRASWRYLLHHPWQMGSALLGIVLGVAVVVAVDLANSSASRGFALSQEALAGDATHQILPGPGGLPEHLYVELRTELGLHRSAPVVEATVEHSDGTRFQLLGIDPFAERALRPRLMPAGEGTTTLDPAGAGALLASTEARRLGLSVGDPLHLAYRGRAFELTLRGLIDDEGAGNLLLVDIATAQTVLRRYGLLDRIDLALAETGSATEQVDAIARRLPPDAQLVSTSQQTMAVGRMSDAFQLNLTAFSLLALVVGGFLIYNSMSFSVVQRRGLIGCLRAIGATPREIGLLILGEALLLGVVGTVVGLLLGAALAELLLVLVTRTINDLYYTLAVRDVVMAPLSIAKGIGLGVGATLVAALAPARAAAAVQPRTALVRSELETGRTRQLPRLALAGLACLALGGALLASDPSLTLAFASLFLILIGAALLTPVAALGLAQALAYLGGRGRWLVATMAIRSVSAHLSRSAVAIAALMLAVSAVIGVGVMVDSFRQTFVGWLDATLRAEFALSTVGADHVEELRQRIVALPQVAAVDGVRATVVGMEGERITLRATDLPPDGAAAFQWQSPDPATADNPGEQRRLAASWRQFAAGEAVLITEPFAVHRGLEVGDQLRLATSQGEQLFPVAGVVHDYTSSTGAVVMVRDAYRQLWNDAAIDQLAIHAQPGADLGTLETALKAMLASEPALRLSATAALRDYALAIFDRTFTVTRVLELLAMAVAATGVLSALLALALERAREFGTLRALGMTPRELMTLVIMQTGILGLIAGLLALPVGLALAAALTSVINRRAFGWSLDLAIDPYILLQGVVLAVLAAVAAGLLPAWRLRRQSPAAALREE